MLKYFLTDSISALIISTQDFENTVAPLAKDINRHLLVITRDKQITAQLYQPNSAFPLKTEDVGFSNVWYGENDAMLMYTSGKCLFLLIFFAQLLFIYFSNIFEDPDARFNYITCLFVNPGLISRISWGFLDNCLRYSFSVVVEGWKQVSNKRVTGEQTSLVL